jgi:membrane protein YqaA with SNARE-associated domain
VKPIALDARAPTRPAGLRGLHYRLYDWVLHWGAHRHAQWALLLIAFVESSVLPVPPDALLVAMTISRPRRGRFFAFVCTAGSVVGGLFAYFLGWSLWELLHGFFFHYLGTLGFTPQNFQKVQTLYQQNAFLAVFSAGFTPIPYKVFTIGAGVFEVSLATFTIASILGRGCRFFLIAEVVSRVGARALPFLDRYLGRLTIAFVILFALGFFIITRLI